MLQLVKSINEKITGYRTYIAVGLFVAYFIAISHNWMPRVPEIEAALVGAVVVFLRSALE